MEHKYEVTLDGKSAGDVLVRKQGLYYMFSCKCSLPEGIYRLILTCGTVCQSLGVLIPQAGSFILNTQLPVKRAGGGSMSFVLVTNRNRKAATEVFVPIRPDEPFAYLSRLKKSFLIMNGNEAGIHIKQMQE